MQINEIIRFLKRPDAKELIDKHLSSSVNDIILREKVLAGEERKILASLVQLYEKAKFKLPDYVKVRAALTHKAYEQATSQAVAQFKASIIKGKKLLNLSGGLGVDDLALSQSFDQVISIDCDPEVHTLATFNNALLGTTNITRFCAKAETFIKETTEVDVIYLDPDRRAEKNRTLLLEEASPNIVDLQVSLLSKAAQIFVKLSPLTDIFEIRKKLHKTDKIWVISFENEVKEVLVRITREPESQENIALILTKNGAFAYGNQPDISLGKAAVEKPFFVEAAAALIKANIDEAYFNAFGFQKLGPHAAFYVGNQTIPNLPGRAFEIVHQMAYKPKNFDAYLKALGIKKGHVKKRDFPLDTAALKKRHKLADGGEAYFFFFKNGEKELRLIHAQKPKTSHSLF